MPLSNQESVFWRFAPADREEVPSCWFPPKVSVCTPLPPSSKMEFTRTRPAGRLRYGSPELRETLIPAEVSLRIIPK